MAADPVRTVAGGPMAFPIDVAVLEAWLTTASRGDELIYSYGLMPARTAAAWIRARELAGEGEVRLHQRRRADGKTTEWYAVRRAPQAGEDTPDRAAFADGDESAEDAVLRILKRYAKLRLACPTNGAIARELGCSSEQAAYRIRRLKDAGAIRVEQQGFDRPRLVWIIGTRLGTAGTER